MVSSSKKSTRGSTKTKKDKDQQAETTATEEHEQEYKEDVPPEVIEMYPKEERSIVSMLAGMTSSAFKIAYKTGGVLGVGRALFPSQERLDMMQETGAYLRDVREVTGMTLSDLSDAMKLSDQTLLEAVENGTSTLSFELILRLAALLARHDPIPFIMRFVRTYNPEVWKILDDWGIGRVPLHFERERQFVNIYRSHDAARKLSDAGYAKVLQFTKSAFEMALHFVAELEKVTDEQEAEEAQAENDESSEE